MEVSIHKQVSRFVEILGHAAEESRAVDMTLGFKCLTADIVMEYCFQNILGALDAPGFVFQLIIDLEELIRGAPLAWYFPGILNGLARVLDLLPKSLVELISEPLAATFEIKKVG